jgi:hypothetical protein
MELNFRTLLNTLLGGLASNIFETQLIAFESEALDEHMRVHVSQAANHLVLFKQRIPQSPSLVAECSCCTSVVIWGSLHPLTAAKLHGMGSWVLVLRMKIAKECKKFAAKE